MVRDQGMIDKLSLLLRRVIGGILTVGAIIVGTGFHGAAWAQPDSLILRVPWNPVQQPESWGEVLGDCLDNQSCIGVAETMGAAIGLPPGAVSGSLTTLTAAGGALSQRVRSEEYRTYVQAPPGYRICDVKTSEISAAPKYENRSPTFKATIQNDQLFELYSFVHKQQLWAGRSWVDTVATVKFVRMGSAVENQCHVRRGVKYQYSCNQRQKDGMPLCSGFAFGGIPRL